MSNARIPALGLGLLSLTMTWGQDTLTVDASNEVVHEVVTEIVADVDSILTTPIDTSIAPWTAQEAMVIDWERQWTEWCATAHCVSSDTSLWNVEDVSADDVESSLDSASIAEGLAALHVLSEMDLRWNPIAHRRIVTYAKTRRQHLGTMLGRSAMYFPLFEEVLARHSMPLELKYLSVVESGLNSEARLAGGCARTLAIHVLHCQSRRLASTATSTSAKTCCWRRKPHVGTCEGCTACMATGTSRWRPTMRDRAT